MTALAHQDFTADRSEQADPAERLAPVAIVRAAAWSLDSLTSLVVDDASIDHERRVEHERQRLWALTAGSPAFMRALSLSNPTLAERVENLSQSLRGLTAKFLEVKKLFQQRLAILIR